MQRIRHSCVPGFEAVAQPNAGGIYTSLLLSVAAFGPTMSLGVTEYISVAAVRAAIGSALTAGHFWKRAPKVTKRALAPPLGTSLRLGVPERRLESVGRRDGPSLAQRG